MEVREKNQLTGSFQDVYSHDDPLKYVKDGSPGSGRYHIKRELLSYLGFGSGRRREEIRRRAERSLAGGEGRRGRNGNKEGCCGELHAF